MNARPRAGLCAFQTGESARPARFHHAVNLGFDDVFRLRFFIGQSGGTTICVCR
jgi:hypothetical protein